MVADGEEERQLADYLLEEDETPFYGRGASQDGFLFYPRESGDDYFPFYSRQSGEEEDLEVYRDSYLEAHADDPEWEGSEWDGEPVLEDYDPIVIFTTPPREPKFLEGEISLKPYVQGEINEEIILPVSWSDEVHLAPNFQIYNPEISHSRSEARKRRRDSEPLETREQSEDSKKSQLQTPVPSQAPRTKKDFLALLEEKGARVPEEMRKIDFLRQLWLLAQGKEKEVTLVQLKPLLSAVGVKGSPRKAEAVALALGVIGLEVGELSRK